MGPPTFQAFNDQHLPGECRPTGWYFLLENGDTTPVWYDPEQQAVACLDRVGEPCKNTQPETIEGAVRRLFERAKGDPWARAHTFIHLTGLDAVRRQLDAVQVEQVHQWGRWVETKGPGGWKGLSSPLRYEPKSGSKPARGNLWVVGGAVNPEGVQLEVTGAGEGSPAEFLWRYPATPYDWSLRVARTRAARLVCELHSLPVDRVPGSLTSNLPAGYGVSLDGKRLNYGWGPAPEWARSAEADAYLGPLATSEPNTFRITYAEPRPLLGGGVKGFTLVVGMKGLLLEPSQGPIYAYREPGRLTQWIEDAWKEWIPRTLEGLLQGSSGSEWEQWER